ncbi:MAG: cold shock domain-containing protein [Desulfobacteraceae bacterium]|nr:cold shock domain-containing protein [Desulfobacteraceae bacterium]
MAEGTIKWYNEKKGFGFIETENDGEFFVHRSGIADHGHFGLQKMDKVSFEIKKTPRGVQAIQVRPI